MLWVSICLKIFTYCLPLFSNVWGASRTETAHIFRDSNMSLYPTFRYNEGTKRLFLRPVCTACCLYYSLSYFRSCHCTWPEYRAAGSCSSWVINYLWLLQSYTPPLCVGLYRMNNSTITSLGTTELWKAAGKSN